MYPLQSGPAVCYVRKSLDRDNNMYGAILDFRSRSRTWSLVKSSLSSRKSGAAPHTHMTLLEYMFCAPVVINCNPVRFGICGETGEEIAGHKVYRYYFFDWKWNKT
jgi:hypothetical protein